MGMNVTVCTYLTMADIERIRKMKRGEKISDLSDREVTVTRCYDDTLEFQITTEVCD